MAITVYFLRHGQTYFNCFARLQGWSDTPLTAQGQQDALRVAKVLAPLRIDYFFSSDLKRAVDTAQLIIDELHPANISRPTTKECFREVFYGSFEGHSNEEGAIWASQLGGQRLRRIGELVDEFGIRRAHDLLKEADPAHLAEDSQQLDHRLNQALKLLEALPDGSNVVVASHGSIIQYLAGTLDPGQQYANPANGALMKLVLDGQRAFVDGYNQFAL
ncbi:histidine phosphatase family protein [Limosilactobacillus antri]|uniref:Phosphoglycerate mutase n=1 Tax=Limosilactobacillus antri DSM 16041 TaxID=525309 RepID=C8P6U8_9LACO|nr:histidine phosphatase family protein [Limosilactobacillus antri]EEW53886.1 phosphoglycerate mutase family protein [Limosilactobacillus antri DSM 16041]KRK60980.1 phosphoglycerate mutase [Limosilactobacillus antri DSM 16041]